MSVSTCPPPHPTNYHHNPTTSHTHTATFATKIPHHRCPCHPYPSRPPRRFWYHLFFFSTALGGELFYSVFFCFWAWNVDGAVLRRVIMVWMVTMYIGECGYFTITTVLITFTVVITFTIRLSSPPLCTLGHASSC